MNPVVLGGIFARGGSQGVPRKNVRLLGGVPLIGHAIRAARACPLIDRVIVSTDDEEIASLARGFGAETPFVRPAALATDSAPEWLAWRHLLEYVEMAPGAAPTEALVVLPTTSPLREPADIARCIERFREGDADVVITTKHTDRNPYYNMVVRQPDGYVRLAMRPEKPIFSRQTAPEVLDMTTVAYVVSPEFVRRESYIFAGRVKTVVVAEESGWEIDSELDLAVAEVLLQRRHGEGRG